EVFVDVTVCREGVPRGRRDTEARGGGRCQAAVGSTGKAIGVRLEGASLETYEGEVPEPRQLVAVESASRRVGRDTEAGSSDGHARPPSSAGGPLRRH